MIRLSEVEEILDELREEKPELWKEAGKTSAEVMVAFAEGACDKLVESGVYPDRRTCVIETLKENKLTIKP